MKTLKRRLSSDWNLLACHPHTAAEWDYERNGALRPEDVTLGSNRSAWWICRLNSDHRWQTVPVTRCVGHGCGVCAGKSSGRDTSVAGKAPGLVREWHPDRTFP